MKKVKTHTFKLGTYHVCLGAGWDGICDVPDKPGQKQRLEISVLDTGDDRRDLRSQLHEAMHAEGCDDKFLHREDDPCDNLARWLIRMGWRRKQ